MEALDRVRGRMIRSGGTEKSSESGGKFERRDGLPWKRVVLPTNSDRIQVYMCLHTYIRYIHYSIIRHIYKILV